MPSHEGTAWLVENWTALDVYDGRWIAASGLGIIVNAKNYAQLLLRLQKAGVQRTNVVVMYVWFGAFA